MEPEFPPRDEKAFYIESDCCLACGVPESIAPELFGWAGSVCALRRQPCTSGEIGRMLDAMGSSEVDCIRYGGNDPAILVRVAGAGLADLADERAAQAYPPIYRNRAKVRLRPGTDNRPEAWARQFREHLRQQVGYSGGRRYRLLWSLRANHVRYRERHPFRFRLRYGFRRPVFSVTFDAAAPSGELWLGAGDMVSRGNYALQEWLAAHPEVEAIAWFSREEWESGGAGLPYWL